MFFTAKQFLDKEEVTEFRIPQVDGDSQGLKTTKKKYKPSIIPSPVFGSRVKDVIHVKPNEVPNSEVIKHYDAFRIPSEKYETDADKLSKYGTAFPEFQKITEDDRQRIYGVEEDDIINDFIEKNPENKASKKLSFIKKASDLDEDDNNDALEEKPADCLPIQASKEVSEDTKDESSAPLEGSFDFGFDSLDDLTKDNEDPDFSSNEKEEELSKPIDESSFSFDAGSRYEEESDLDNSLASDNTKDFDESTDSVLEEENDNSNPFLNYKFPPLSIFSKSNKDFTTETDDSEEKIRIIDKTLNDFDIPGHVTTYTRGPSFSRYEVQLSEGINVKKVGSIELNIQMALGAKVIRIQAPIPGKQTIGIEVPNDKRTTVQYGDIINEDFIKNSKPLEVTLGENIDGEFVKIDIAKTPHCLIGGATSSGKSVSMNTILISLLLKNKPDDLKLILIDPKQVEFSCYDDLPHLVTPVISDPEMSNAALKWAVDEMDRRYTRLSNMRVRDIITFNKRALAAGEPKMPYLLIVIDELADLMQTCSSEVEDSIKRLCQKARGCGIHLLVATQRPDVKNVPGGIKANIPTRIAFRVFSKTDSQVIIDEPGAENLLGQGDMLVKTEGSPMRLQGAFIPDEEIDEVTEFIRNEITAEYVFTHEDLKKRTERDKRISTKQEETPEMLYNCAMFCLNSGTCSINALQNEFNLGFSRAQKVVASLESHGVVSEKTNRNQPREVIVDSYKIDEIFSNLE